MKNIKQIKSLLKQINNNFYLKSFDDVVCELMNNDLDLEILEEIHLSYCKFKRVVKINNQESEIVYYSNDDMTTEVIYIQLI